MPVELTLPTLKAVADFMGSLFAGEAGGVAFEALQARQVKRRAINDTDAAFPRTWRVKASLKDWTQTQAFELLLLKFVNGLNVEQADAATVQSFITDGHFASGMGTERETRAHKVVARFFNELLRGYVNTAEGLDHVRRRQEQWQERTDGKLDALHQVLLQFVDDHRREQTRHAVRRGATLSQYAQTVMEKCRKLPLQAFDASESDARRQKKPMRLEEVYQDLNTTTVARDDTQVEPGEEHPMGERPRALTAMEVITDHTHVVLVGEPGSGKSTLLRHLALCLAGHAAEPQAGWLARLAAWPEGERPPIPLVVQLRDLAYAHRETKGKGTAGHLWDFVTQSLRDLPGMVEVLARRMQPGEEGLLVILDGLDEIPGAAQRTFVRDSVSDFLKRHEGCRVVVTCRTRSYQNPAWQLSGVPVYELAPFDERQIDAFVRVWHAELVRTERLTPAEAQVLEPHLMKALRRKDLWRLATNPLLLTVMAWVHTHGERLPEARALLYEQMVDLLLWDWDDRKREGDETGLTLRALLHEVKGRSEIHLRKVLWALAYQAHAEGGLGDEEQLADLHEWAIRKAIAALHPEEGRHDWAERVLNQLRLRAGLLQEREPEVFTFPHRTFQEYLAGAHLVSENCKDDPLDERVYRLIEESALWRMPVLLAAGWLAHKVGVNTPLAIVGRLCQEDMKDTETAWRKVMLAAEVILEMEVSGAEDKEYGRILVGRVRERLVALMRRSGLPAAERAEAGRILGRLGDPRAAVTTVEEMAFCLVPEGPFYMGSDPEEDSFSREEERRCHEVDVGYAYWIGRYPVTQGQYALFAAAGYDDDAYWTEAGLARKARQEIEGPPALEEPFDLPNHPVVEVSWYEAAAYARWLTARLRGQGLLPGGWEVALPSEAEWEKAARGGLELPGAPVMSTPRGGWAGEVDGLIANGKQRRIYPWGEEAPTPERANYNETKVGTTNAVGCFPQGASPYGVEELSGNVWDWTRSLWGKYPYPAPGAARLACEATEGDDPRVLRGGAFDLFGQHVRCAYRLNVLPFLHGRRVGFRVVVHPFPLSSEASGR